MRRAELLIKSFGRSSIVEEGSFFYCERQKVRPSSSKLAWFRRNCPR